MDNKFSVIYSFHVFPGMEEGFIAAWTELTQLIYQFEGSYGSRLHQAGPELFIGYAQWPDKESWQLSGAELPEVASELRKRMRESCSSIKTEFEMMVLKDLLHEKKYGDLAT